MLQLSDDSSSSPDDRKVFFVDDQQKKESRLVRRLHKELQSRRAELDALDLAVVKQRSNLKQMKVVEKMLLDEKKQSDMELCELKAENYASSLPRGQRRR